MIELDYRQLKRELGLDHYEGRSCIGWQHHALVTTAHASPDVGANRPISPAAGPHPQHPKRSAYSMPIFDCLSGRCHTCQRTTRQRDREARWTAAQPSSSLLAFANSCSVKRPRSRRSVIA